MMLDVLVTLDHVGIGYQVLILFWVGNKNRRNMACTVHWPPPSEFDIMMPTAYANKGILPIVLLDSR